MKFLTFLFFASISFATVNEPLRINLFSGYRNDRIHWHLQDPGEPSNLTYSEIYRDVQFWENGLILHVIHRDLTFFLKGAYAAFGWGEVFQRYFNRSQAPVNPRFSGSTNGWAADASGYFGYAVNLTADRVYKVILTPLIGYSASFENLNRSSVKPSSIDGFISEMPQSFRQTWNGVLFGVSLQYQPTGPVVCGVGYSYHLMHNRTHTHRKNLQSGNTVTESIQASSSGNTGQHGWMWFEGILQKGWRMGLGAEIRYFTTRVVDASVRPRTSGDYAQKFKLRWTPISGWGQISRSF